MPIFFQMLWIGNNAPRVGVKKTLGGIGESRTETGNTEGSKSAGRRWLQSSL
jgi:hypothetical protein